MAFFDKVKEAGIKGLDKAKDLGEQAKIKIDEEKAQVKLRDCYNALGKALAEKYPELLKENFAEEAAAIEAIQAEIAKLQADLAAAKEK